MALKRKLDKAVWEKLSDEIKPLYAEKDGSYVLDVEGSSEDDTGELRRANERLKQEAKEAKAEAKRLRDAAEEGSELDAKKRGDIETLEKSWKEKLSARETELNGTIEKLQSTIKKTMLESAAKDIATIAKSPALLLPHVERRLDVDLSGETPTLRILDKDGKPSALTAEDLKKEFVANKDFSDIIVASKASGGAVKNSGESKTGSLGTPQDATKPLASLNPRDLAATMKAKKEAAAAQ